MIKLIDIIEEYDFDRDTLSFWKKYGWTKDTKFRTKLGEEIKQKILSIRGIAVVLTDDWIKNKITIEDGKKLLERGSLIRYNSIRTLHGEHNYCHGNSALTWFKNKSKYVIQTGFALSNNDISWHEHTWLFDIKKKQLVDTTGIRKYYYGFTLTEEESLSSYNIYK